MTLSTMCGKFDINESKDLSQLRHLPWRSSIHRTLRRAIYLLMSTNDSLSVSQNR
jgi:hypothetical protein